MKHYAKYLIAASDKFDPLNYFSVEDEIMLINEKTRHIPGNSKAEIIISYLKDHRLDNKWASVNSKLTELLASGVLVTEKLESLFDSCQNNASFRQDLETYLHKSFENKMQLQDK